MTGPGSNSHSRSGVWITWSVVAAGFLYLSLMQGALDLGAAHHDAFCQEHGWAASEA